MFFRLILECVLFLFAARASHSLASPQGVATKTTASCLASTNIITVLEMVPYKLHSPDLQSAVFTINKIYNVQVQ